MIIGKWKHVSVWLTPMSHPIRVWLRWVGNAWNYPTKLNYLSQRRRRAHDFLKIIMTISNFTHNVPKRRKDSCIWFWIIILQSLNEICDERQLTRLHRYSIPSSWCIPTWNRTINSQWPTCDLGVPLKLTTNKIIVGSLSSMQLQK